MSVNSAAVLRLMGKGVGGTAPAGVVRGRGATRGGRGKTRRRSQKRWPEHFPGHAKDVVAEGSRGYRGQSRSSVYSPPPPPFFFFPASRVGTLPLGLFK